MLLKCAIRPKLDRRITRSGDHLQRISLLGPTGACAFFSILILLRDFEEVHGPDLFLVHLERILALLLAEVPYLDNTIDARCGNLETSIEPCCLD